MRALIQGLISHRELLQILVVRNFKIRYKETEKLFDGCCYLLFSWDVGSGAGVGEA